MENVLIKEKINLKFKKPDLRKFIIYFAFYSFIGFCFESIFGIFSKGVLESRKSFLFGPFCAIYGIGAILMIVTLKPLKNNTGILFIGSMIIGAVAEYLMSYICEIYFHFKWWDYTDYFFNIDGRTCLFFMLIWGVLGTLLIKYVNPKFDLLIEKIQRKLSNKMFNSIIFGFTLFFVIDISLTVFALKYFYAKISYDYALPKTNYSTQKLNYYSQYKILNENNLLKNFPNIRIAGKKMDNVFVDTLYKVKPTYYIKIFSDRLQDYK